MPQNTARPISLNYRMGSKAGGADILAADLSPAFDGSDGYMGLLIISLATAGIPSIVYNNGEADEEVCALHNGASLSGVGAFHFAFRSP